MEWNALIVFGVKGVEIQVVKDFLITERLLNAMVFKVTAASNTYETTV